MQSRLGSFAFQASELEEDRDLITTWVKEGLLLDGVNKSGVDNIDIEFHIQRTFKRLIFTTGSRQVVILQYDKKNRDKNHRSNSYPGDFHIDFRFLRKSTEKYIWHRKKGPQNMVVDMDSGLITYALYFTHGKQNVFPCPYREYYSTYDDDEQILVFRLTSHASPLELVLKETRAGAFIGMHFTKDDLYLGSEKLKQLSQSKYKDVIKYLVKRYDTSIDEFLLHPHLLLREMAEHSLKEVV